MRVQVPQMIFDQFIKLRLSSLPILLLLLLLHGNQTTSKVSSFCSFALTFTFSSEVSLRFTLITFFTVRSYFVFI